MQWTKGVVREVLPNGLTVLVQPDHSASVVAVVTHVRAGYFDEPDDWVGIAHVLEHMYFKGTARRGPGDIARETQLLGGYCNAGTIYDKTVYHTVLPSERDGLARALDIQADALMHAALDAKELAREIEVIVQEARRKQDTPEAVTIETLFSVLFRVHRMRRWRIGSERGLRCLTVDDLREYYTSRYVPGRVILALVGAVDSLEALEQARATFGTWDRPTPPLDSSPKEPRARGCESRVLHGEVERPLVALGWRTVDALHADAPVLDVASAVLSTGRSSRLYRALRHTGIANAVSTSHYTPTEIGVFTANLEVAAGRFDEAVVQTLGQIEALGNRGPTIRELQRVRRQMTTLWARHMESADGRAAALCEAEALGDFAILDRQYETMLAATPDDVQRVVGDYLDPAFVCGTAYLPDGTEPGVFGAWPPPVPATSVPAVRVTEPKMAVRRSESHGVDEVYEGELRRRRLPGMDVVATRRPGTGLARVGLHVRGLPAEEDEETAGLSRLLARCSVRGAGGLGAEQLSELSERLGGSIVPAMGRDVMGWDITVPVGAVAEAVSLLEFVAGGATLEDEAIRVERMLQASDARRVRDDMFRYPIQQVLAQAFPSHPYGRPLYGSPERVEMLTMSQVRAWHDRVASRAAVLVVVGDMDAGRALDVVSAATRRRGSGDGGAGVAGPSWGAGSSAESRDKKQTALTIAYPAGDATSADREALTVLCALLSGLAGRMFDELRERRSLAYTVAALRWQARAAGALITYIATSPEREDEAREGMLLELARVVREPPDEHEFDRARSYATGLLAISRQRSASVANELLEAWTNDSLDHPGQRAARLRAVSISDVVELCERLLAAEPAEFVVRGVANSL